MESSGIWERKTTTAPTSDDISYDEPQKIENDVQDMVSGYPHGRRDKMWPLYLSGGAGFEWYVQKDGGGHSFDQDIDDFNQMAEALEWTGHALTFMNMLPVLEMIPNMILGSSAAGGNTYVLAKPGETYALFNDRNGGAFSLDLTGASGAFEVSWYDPRTGQIHAGGTIPGGGIRSLGNAPHDQTQDWAALVRRQEVSPPAAPANLMVEPRF